LAKLVVAGARDCRFNQTEDSGQKPSHVEAAQVRR
jgi:hypothetical protein